MNTKTSFGSLAVPEANRTIESHKPERQGAHAFHEVWSVKLTDPEAHRALWLRFTLLVTKNGFRRIAETWAVYFERDEQREIIKAAMKQTYDISAFQSKPGSFVRIGDCELSLNPNSGRTHGTIRSKGHVLKWDLQFRATEAVPKAKFRTPPDSLVRAGILRNFGTTLSEGLRFDGSLEYNGKTVKWSASPGMLAHHRGPRSDHSWVWGQANAFTNDRGEHVPFVFEGMTTRPHVFGSVKMPKLSSFYFAYDGKEYVFNSVWDSVRSKSVHTLTQWEFQADRGELSFRGKATAEHKDFAGLTYEDTNGSLLYGAVSKLSSVSVHVYRRGKLENSFYANGTAAFEIVSRERNPYVPLLI